MPPFRLLAGLLVACCLLLSTDAARAEAGAGTAAAPTASPAVIDPRLGEMVAMMPAELAGLSLDEHLQAPTGEQIAGIMQPSEAALLDALLATNGKSLDDCVAASTWLRFGESLALVLQAHRIAGVDAATTVDDWVAILSQHLTQPEAGSRTVAGRQLTTLSDAAAPELPSVYLFPADDVVWMIWTSDEAMAETAVLTLAADAAPREEGWPPEPSPTVARKAWLHSEAMTIPATDQQTGSPPGGPAVPQRKKRRARPAPVEDFSAAGMQRTVEQIETELHQRYPQADLSSINAAFAFAVTAHGDQQRVSGEPYVSHPLAVAQILAELGLDPVAVTAAILHDVPEDTDYSLGDLEERFGVDVARLVDGVTKLSKFSTLSHEQQQAENIRKMFLAMAEDIRVVLIKLADRLHNMRTLSSLPPAKQQRIAKQTAEIYAPLAERLGIWQMKWELEDLSFKYLDPEAYRELAGQLESHRRAREAYVKRAMDVLDAALLDAGIKADLSGRPKHLYSIYRKMQRKRAEFGEIYDVHALRVLVADVRECYAALGVVHSLWRPIPGQFDDYIAMPKNNGYQSLHTAVVALDGKPLEVQIRSRDMHRVSEIGIAAHWRYKEGSRSDRAYDAKLAWVRQLMEWQQDVSDATEFVEGVKLDIFQDQVFVFTPRGDVKDMPAGATPLDFAYRIHTEVGHACIGAKVNNRLVPLDYKLKNGDIVEIVTTKSAHGPSRDWLNIVTTSHAKEKIRQWFKRQQRDENIAHGKQVLDRELHRLARTSLDKVSATTLEELAESHNFKSIDDFYAAVGYGQIGAQQIVSRLGVVDDVDEVELPQVAPPPTQRGGVRVRGVGDLLVRWSKCCHPIPGDPIVGFITRGRGVTVHLATCPTILNEKAVERLIDVEWETAAQQTYPIAIIIEAYDRTGLLSDISNVVAEDRINIVAASVHVHKDQRATVQATLEVSSVAQLSRVMAHLEQLKDVYSVQRDRT